MTGVQEIHVVPLTAIHLILGWNARSGNWHQDAADPTSDDGGFEGLKESMRVAGRNDEPVLLRPIERGEARHGTARLGEARHGEDFLYFLVDGFRRVRAAKELGWESIRAIIEPMTEFEARRRNLAAQAGRVRHKTADLAWGLAELKKLGGPKLTNEELGTLVGISGSYASVLCRIMTDVDPKVTDAWRASAVKVDVPSLQRLTVLPREQHWKEWESLVLESQTRPSPRAKFATALRLERQARELGRMIGALDRLGVVIVRGNFLSALALVTKTVLEPDAANKLETVMTEGYHEGLSGKDPR